MKEGEHFLHQKDPRLHTSKEVEHEKARKKRKGEKVSEKPADKITDFLSVLERTHLGHKDDPRVLERIKRSYHKEHVIKEENIPQHYWNTQAGIMIREGRGADMEQAGVEKEVITLKNGKEHTNYHFPEDLKEQNIEVLQSNQQRSLDKWLDYLTSDDALYPTWAKYWAFKSVLSMGKFEKLQTEEVPKKGEEETKKQEKARFQKRTKDTVSSFPLLNPRALAQTIGVMSERLKEKAKPKKERQPIQNVSERLSDPDFQKLLSTENFAKLYAQFLLEMPEYRTEGLKETRGEWKKYPQSSDEEEAKKLVASLEGYPLEWCTADPDTAKTQLEGGDFWVYYSIDEEGEPNIPRLAIRMEGQNKIAEPPRGIAPDQNLDPYIGPVLEKKMEDFGTEGELYKKRVKDMKRLTDIEERINAGTFNEEENPDFQSDLIFLYETDHQIEGFGYEKDPRIKDLREERNPEEDMPLVFDCEPEQIATNPDQITSDTKAYVGPLQPNIFETLAKHNIEHVYIEFPEGKIRKTRLEIGGKTSEELTQELEKENIKISGYARGMLESPDFQPQKTPEEMDLIRLKIQDLGFENSATTDQVYQRAQELGLELCPAEVGPQFRLQYRDQPMDEWEYIGMKQIADSDGNPRVFRVVRFADGEWLNDSWAFPDYRWRPSHGFVFRLRKDES